MDQQHVPGCRLLAVHLAAHQARHFFECSVLLAEPLKHMCAASAQMQCRRGCQVHANRVEQLVDAVRPGLLIDRDEEDHSADRLPSLDASPRQSAWVYSNGGELPVCGCAAVQS